MFTALFLVLFASIVDIGGGRRFLRADTRRDDVVYRSVRFIARRPRIAAVQRRRTVTQTVKNKKASIS